MLTYWMMIGFAPFGFSLKSLISSLVNMLQITLGELLCLMCMFLLVDALVGLVMYYDDIVEEWKMFD